LRTGVKSHEKEIKTVYGVGKVGGHSKPSERADGRKNPYAYGAYQHCPSSVGKGIS
jgi:hypothetical protein